MSVRPLVKKAQFLRDPDVFYPKLTVHEGYDMRLSICEMATNLLHGFNLSLNL